MHCTHGVNRTGFIVCSYLVFKLKWSPNKALKVFEQGRGTPMEHHEYIDYVVDEGNKLEGLLED